MSLKTPIMVFFHFFLLNDLKCKSLGSSCFRALAAHYFKDPLIYSHMFFFFLSLQPGTFLCVWLFRHQAKPYGRQQCIYVYGPVLSFLLGGAHCLRPWSVKTEKRKK